MTGKKPGSTTSPVSIFRTVDSDRPAAYARRSCVIRRLCLAVRIAEASAAASAVYALPARGLLPATIHGTALPLAVKKDW